VSNYLGVQLSWQIDRALEALGFSRRARGVLIQGVGIATVDEIRTLPWDDSDNAYGLRSSILRSVHGGPSTVREVEAYRAGIDPADAPRSEISISVKIPAGAAAALDLWREAQIPPLTRSQAVAALVIAGVGFDPPGSNR
jgi:hypothetical protein